ncbi:UNVERIFIED_CONTAM: hypothetical protein Sangu_0980600 [Sesamum angustifolium]|uniref:Uncharacterized protein n=1 Tax=Sesamum angustifolium TaxID=2727405 RepID=A0AAW2PGA5_9LAMI
MSDLWLGSCYIPPEDLCGLGSGCKWMIPLGCRCKLKMQPACERNNSLVVLALRCDTQRCEMGRSLSESR